MTFWKIASQEGVLVGFVPDEKLSMALTLCGVNPHRVRNALDIAKANPVDMQIGKPLAAHTEKERQEIPDLVFWSWIAIFSDRAASTAIEFGCAANEFWPCRFQSNPQEESFFHLPLKTFDIVDVERSVFLQMLPLNPPIPMFIKVLVTKQLPDRLPPCFMADIPQTQQAFPELFVREDFKLAWERKNYSGARFQQLS